MKYTIGLCCMLLLLGAGCDTSTTTDMDAETNTSSTSAEMNETNKAQMENQVDVTVYTSESWKSIIDPMCQTFFDGCNTCTRMEGVDMASCTRMACSEYTKPGCTDETSPADLAPIEAEADVATTASTTTSDVMDEVEITSTTKATDYNSSRSNRTTQ